MLQTSQNKFGATAFFIWEPQNVLFDNNPWEVDKDRIQVMYEL